MRHCLSFKFKSSSDHRSQLSGKFEQLMTESGLIVRSSETCRLATSAFPLLALPCLALSALLAAADCFQAMINPALDLGSLSWVADFDVELLKWLLYLTEA